jgi:hypothetical protein
MRFSKLLGFSLCAMLLGAVLAPGARADEWNKKTILTVNEPIEVSGHVLNPGTYVFKLAENLYYRQFVQIWTGDEQHFIATVITIPTYRDEPTDRTVFRFGERSARSPEVLLKWFYPGDSTGFEFLYPRYEYRQLTATAVDAG